MQLCAPDAINNGFVTTEDGGQPQCKKNSSVDLTIGTILKKGTNGEVEKHESGCTLEPQETVYLVSKEILNIKEGHTAYVFLKNRLSQKGVLAFNTGIIDEGYNGCISTLVTNLSSRRVDLPDGLEFFRVVIHSFDCESAHRAKRTESPDVEKYIERRRLDLKHFPDSFLDRGKIQQEIYSELKSISTAWSMRNLTIAITAIGLAFAIFTAFIPYIQGFVSVPNAKDAQAMQSSIAMLVSKQEQMRLEVDRERQRSEKLLQELADQKSKLDVSVERVKELENKLRGVEIRIASSVHKKSSDKN
ncbi:MAG: hypothetical protein KUF75_07615 [Candidatus Thiodiazotropha sp. (ex Ctena orbiculata)]|nr:hypothetical protein [Candidatus Thiodiazotropha taylori]